MDAPIFGISNLSAIWNNNIVFTNFDEAIFGTRCPTNSKRIFYMWDLDWQNYGYSRKLLTDIVDKCDYLYVRDKSYTDPIRSFFGRTPDGVNANFALEEFCLL